MGISPKLRVIRVILALSVLTVSAEAVGMQCINDSYVPEESYWTPWYSSATFFDEFVGENEDQSQLCSGILDTECRALYTHQNVTETGLIYMETCSAGRIVCMHSTQEPNKRCLDMEMRLRISPGRPPDMPDYHWSLSELDGGGKGDEREPWECSEYPPLEEIHSLIGNMSGVVQGLTGSAGLPSQRAPDSSDNLCAVSTSGLNSISFKPYRSNCITKAGCCGEEEGISVAFWLWKNESYPQNVPLHLFRSSSLLVTLQEGRLYAQYRRFNQTWRKKEFIQDFEWTHITLTFNQTAGLTLYIDGEMRLAEHTQPLSWTVPLPNQMETEGSSFTIFSPENGNVTSSDIRPIAMTDLRIFYRWLDPEVVGDIYDRLTSATSRATTVTIFARIRTTPRADQDETTEDPASLNLNYLAVLAVIPAVAACYFLCRKLKLMELVEQRIAANKAASLKAGPKDIKGGRNKPKQGPKSGKVHPITSE